MVTVSPKFFALNEANKAVWDNPDVKVAELPSLGGGFKSAGFAPDEVGSSLDTKFEPII